MSQLRRLSLALALLSVASGTAFAAPRAGLSLSKLRVLAGDGTSDRIAASGQHQGARRTDLPLSGAVLRTAFEVLRERYPGAVVEYGDTTSRGLNDLTGSGNLRFTVTTVRNPSLMERWFFPFGNATVSTTRIVKVVTGPSGEAVVELRSYADPASLPRARASRRVATR